MSKKRKLRSRKYQAKTIEPQPSVDREQFVHFPLERFLTEKALWAANYFVLWPIGLALTADVEIVDGFVVQVKDIHVREWVMPDGQKSETINQSPSDNKADFELFLGFVRERILDMKPEERVIALRRLANFGVAQPDQILAVGP